MTTKIKDIEILKNGFAEIENMLDFINFFFVTD